MRGTAFARGRLRVAVAMAALVALGLLAAIAATLAWRAFAPAPQRATPPIASALPEAAVPTPARPASVPRPPARADFGEVVPTASARTMADWVVARGDNVGRPFMVLDKVDARLYVFAPTGLLLGRSAVLLGKARGDDAAPGIGERPLKLIREAEKTTPAGRFETTPGRNTAGEEIVWVDYADAISMHRVRRVAASERRLERLASPTPGDNRISFGCINVPVAFFDAQVAPTLGRQPGVAYVIPETRTIAQVFEPPADRVAGATPGRTVQAAANP
jgi:hypothetical protein